MAAGCERHSSWKGGRLSTKQGYIQVALKDDDEMGAMCNSTGYVPEHRLVMARYLGRPLDSSETVHHRDGDRANNDLYNLQLRQGRHGKGVCMKCKDCGSTNIVSMTSGLGVNT